MMTRWPPNETMSIQGLQHHRADPECPSCAEGYPKVHDACSRGGLMHGQRDDYYYDEGFLTLCDGCVRSER